MATKRKLTLFQLGQSALSHACGKPVPGYGCPICLRGFENIDDLTEEHVPPASIGGKVICLTCHECNCGSGDNIDAAVHNEMNFRKFGVRDEKPKRIKLSVGNLEVNADIIFRANDILIQILDKQNDPKLIENFKPFLRQNLIEKESLHIKHSSHHTRKRADVGYLKSAYLVLFSKLGYRYILRRDLNRVRQQILHPSDDILNAFRVFMNNADMTTPAIYWIDLPVPCLGVSISDSIVYLPHFYGDDSFYEALAKNRTVCKEEEFKASGTMPWSMKFEAALDFRGRNEE